MAREIKDLPPLTDKDIIPSGKYKKGGLEGGETGVKMEDVPAKYLIYIYDNFMCDDRVRAYIDSNIDVIREQAKRGY
jgi:hypothetical protein